MIYKRRWIRCNIVIGSWRGHITYELGLVLCLTRFQNRCMKFGVDLYRWFLHVVWWRKSVLSYSEIQSLVCLYVVYGLAYCVPFVLIRNFLIYLVIFPWHEVSHTLFSNSLQHSHVPGPLALQWRIHHFLTFNAPHWRIENRPEDCS